MEPHRIALLMPRANVHTRGIFCGITRYARPFRAWNFHLGLPHAEVLRRLRRWKPSGIIASIPDERLEQRFARLGIPMVNCSSDLANDGVDRVVTDNAQVGVLAAEYFLDRGYRELAFCGEPRSLASRQRFDAFRLRAEQAGVVVHTLASFTGAVMVGELGWEVSSRDLALQRWVAGLPKPIGLLACHDPMAMLLSEVCREIGIHVPDQVAILGVDNDAMLCEMAYPTLSSVQTPHERIGFEAARRLDELMQHPRSQPRTLRLAPLSMVTRQSTDTAATGDSLVAEAMRYIQEHADQPIRVSTVVARVGVSRRTLEQRFMAATGQSVLYAIQHAHISLANQLLRETELTVEQIASACGFNSRERFSTVYRQVTGHTPRSAFP